jgi:site-specific DNA recombinase
MIAEISRDQEHVAAFYKHLTLAGISIVTLAEGQINELHVGLKGTMNVLFLKDLALKIRRGQAGRAASGHCPGGLGYG